MVCVGIEHAESPEWTPAFLIRKRERERTRRERRDNKEREKSEDKKMQLFAKKNEKNFPHKIKTHLLDVLHDAADRCVTVLVAEGVDVDLVGAVEVL